MSKVYDVVFHDWIYRDTVIKYYGEGLYYSDQVHFVRDRGYMNNRNEDLLQLAIL